MINPERKVLQQPPIFEALLDIRVKLPSGTTIEMIESLYEKVKSTFPVKQKKYSFSGMIKFQPLESKVKSENEEPKLMGYVFQSEDKKKIFQATFDGFTFNLLKPYKNWEEFKNESQRLWKMYEEVLKPVIRERVALRFINKLKFPSSFDPSKYFTTIPTLGGNLKSYPIENLFCQTTFRNDKIGSDANVIEGIEPSEDGKEKTFIFDIDVFCRSDFSVEDMWKKLDDLREFKNEIFFESITKDTYDLIK
jgi:uncharacterized protein (TIGR04255 family)